MKIHNIKDDSTDLFFMNECKTPVTIQKHVV